MDKLIAYFANHTEGLRAALAIDGEQLRAPGEPKILGWSLVSSFRGEPLVKSRPTEPREEIDTRDVFDGMRTDSALVALRYSSLGGDSLDAGGPFRFGWWSGVVVGAHGRSPQLRSAILARSSDFLARLAGPRSSGHGVFALFLSRVHATVGLDEAQPDRAAIERALQETLAVWVEECERVNEPAGSLVLGVSHRELLAVAAREQGLRTVRRNGMRDRALLERLRGKELGKLDPERLRYLWITTDAPGAAGAQRDTDAPKSAWVEHRGPTGVVLSVDRQCDLRATEL
ncbi:MAG: hypothetical protein JNK05_18850 [Myxococcales bacterium]|nr:hypothetical protein [Myxococcales bacterium]